MLSQSFRRDAAPLCKLALPLVLTGLAQSGTWFFETLFLSHVSSETLAAGSLVTWLYGTMIVIMLGLLSSINVLVAYRHGAKDIEGITHIARDGLWLAILLSIPMIILCRNIAPIFSMFGQSQNIVHLADSYLQAISWGVLPNFILIALLEVLIGTGHSRMILAMMLLMVFCNIFSSYVFIFGAWGFPVLGIAGAGWGITAGDWLSLIVLVITILMRPDFKAYFTRLFHLVKWSQVLELIKIGLPMGLMYSVEVGFFLALAISMGALSPQFQAANQIAMQFNGLLMSTVFSLAQAVTVRMGHLLGAEEKEAAFRVVRIGVIFAVTAAFLLSLIMWFAPSILVAADLDLYDPNNHALIQDIYALLIASAFFQIFEAARIMYFGSLRALKDTHFTLIVSILSFWGIGLLVGRVFAIHLQLGGQGYWWAMTLGAMFSVSVLRSRLKSKMSHSIPLVG